MGLGCPLLLELSDRRLRRCAATLFYLAFISSGKQTKSNINFSMITSYSILNTALDKINISTFEIATTRKKIELGMHDSLT